jgi:alternate signal-mediated exported protein
MRRVTRFQLVILPAVLAFAMGCLAGTFALWWATASQQGGTIASGDFDLALGDLYWEQTTGTVPSNARQHGFDAESLAGFVMMPGETVVMSQGVTTSLVGDNLKAALTVEWDGVAPSDVSAAVRLTGPQGVVDTQPIGTAITIPDYAVAASEEGGAAGLTAWTIEVTAQRAFDNAHTTDLAGDGAKPGLPGLRMTLQQVRG